MYIPGALRANSPASICTLRSCSSKCVKLEIVICTLLCALSTDKVQEDLGGPDMRCEAARQSPHACVLM